jgi:hypothetical protein
VVIGDEPEQMQGSSVVRLALERTSASRFRLVNAAALE